MYQLIPRSIETCRPARSFPMVREGWTHLIASADHGFTVATSITSTTT
jgi:hypothetical protein